MLGLMTYARPPAVAVSCQILDTSRGTLNNETDRVSSSGDDRRGKPPFHRRNPGDQFGNPHDNKCQDDRRVKHGERRALEEARTLASTVRQPEHQQPKASGYCK
jgi:hypothetical protein